MRVDNVTAGASKAAEPSETKSKEPSPPLTPAVKSKNSDSKIIAAPVLDADASAKLDALAALLDLSSLESHADIELRFGQIARALIHDHILVITIEDGSRTEYDLLEVEFYLRKPGHDDPFAHGAYEQQVSGKW